nr:MAG TPA_asm: hypothetical protein [Caudoviricetes sp.]
MFESCRSLRGKPENIETKRLHGKFCLAEFHESSPNLCVN